MGKGVARCGPFRAGFYGKGKIMDNTTLIVVIIVLLLLFGGGGGYYWSRGRR